MLLYDAVMQCVSERVSRNALAIPASWDSQPSVGILSGHNIEYICLNLFTLRRFNNNESSGGRQIRFFPY